MKYPTELTKEALYHNLGYDWDAELNELHGEDLWAPPNSSSRHVREMIITECLRVRDGIKKLPVWRRLLNKF